MPSTAAPVYSFGRGMFRGKSKLGSEFSYPELTTLNVGNFVYPKLMAWEGALAVVPPECDGLVVSPEFPVFEIDGAIVGPIVLDEFFRDPQVWPLLPSGSTGTNLRRKRLNPQHFLNLTVPVPSVHDQRMLRTLEALRAQIAHRHGAARAELNEVMPASLDRAFAA